MSIENDSHPHSQEADGQESSPASLLAGVPLPGLTGDSDEQLSADEIYDHFFEWVESQGIEPWDHQQEAAMDLVSGEHVILATPTGSGKSMVAQMMLFMALCTGRQAYYTAPIKALVSEKFFDAVRVFGRDNVGMATGDVTINPEAPIICCTAEILANKALRGDANEYGLSRSRSDICVAMDEFHFYGEAERGWAWQVPLLTLPKAQFLLMSATLGDTNGIVSTLDRCTQRPTETVDDAVRPVPLSYRYELEPISQTVEEQLESGNAPIYVVHFSQREAVAAAEDLSNFGVTTKQQREQIKERIKGFPFTTAFGKVLRRLLVTGVGVHHAGMLPRYRRLVEQLAQEGLLPVICGTDTLGVGINVPIHTVIFTALVKYDGVKERRLRAREFHQIAGRAGRSGFDSEGLVIALAPEYDIENAQAEAKAKANPKKNKKIVKKKPREGAVSWNKQTLDKLIALPPETLRPHLRITHSMVLNEVARGGDAHRRIIELIENSAQTDVQKEKLVDRANEIFGTLIAAGVVERHDDGDLVEYETTLELPENFALDEPLSPFLLAALELLDSQSETYALDVVSMVEATLEDPMAILRAQKKEAQNKAIAQWKADGIEYDERLEMLQTVTYPQPLKELLDAAFEQYCDNVPWANDFTLRPKSIVREMIETASDFTGYIARYRLDRAEGILLRYLSDAYHSLSRTIPPDKRTDQLDDIIEWLRVIVRGTDSSLLDEWQIGAAGANPSAPPAMPPQMKDQVVTDRHGVELLVRNAMFRRVQLIARENSEALGSLDVDWGMNTRAWDNTLDDIYADHEAIETGQEARGAQFFILDESGEKAKHIWHVRQVLDDCDGDHDWAIDADVDLDTTQASGSVVFDAYRVAPIDELH